MCVCVGVVYAAYVHVCVHVCVCVRVFLIRSYGTLNGARRWPVAQGYIYIFLLPWYNY